MRLVHLGQSSRYGDLVIIFCRPYQYLARRDFIPVFDAHVTCLACIISTRPETGAWHGWREA